MSPDARLRAVNAYLWLGTYKHDLLVLMVAVPALERHARSSTRGYSMKKFLVVMLMFMVLGFAVPSVSAQRRHRRVIRALSGRSTEIS